MEKERSRKKIEISGKRVKMEMYTEREFLYIITIVIYK